MRHTTLAMGSAEGKLVVVLAFLLLAGFLFVYSASSPLSLRLTGEASSLLKRQIIGGVLGLAALVVLWRVDYHVWAGVDDLLLGGAFVLLLLTLVPPLAEGSRWLRLGPFPFQPSELGKVALVLYISGSLVRRTDRLGSYREGVLPHLLVLGLLGIVLLLQPDSGMLLIYGATVLFLLWVGGVPVRHLLLTLLGAVPVGVAVLFLARYRVERLVAFLNPGAYRDTYGYQTFQSLLAVGSGGVLGRGIGASRAKLFYLPAAHNDFVFSVIAEETGLVGALCVIALLGALVVFGFRVAREAPDKLGALYAYGASFLLGFQTLLNLAVAVGVVPVTGLTLPFLSYGGSSLMVSLMLGGLLLGVARASRRSAVGVLVPGVGE
ncbi:MAG: putative lipid II flippase FtsW [Candidatus Bipolaricaulota bacterium]|nr:putative lipid II flippase FtsW [Candidatus Bipolaricaulota bacterium]